MGGAASCGIFYALSIGSPREALFLQACSIGIGVFVSAALGIDLPGDFDGERKPLWPLFLPLIFGMVSTGAFYALIYGSPRLAQLIELAGISNGAGLAVAFLITVLLWRSAPVQVALAEEAVAFDGSVRVLDLTDEKSGGSWNPIQKPDVNEVIEDLTGASNVTERDLKQNDAAEAWDEKEFQNKEDDSLMTGYNDNTVALEQLKETDVDKAQTFGGSALYGFDQAENQDEQAIKQTEKNDIEQNAFPESSEKSVKQVSEKEVRIDPRGVLDLVKMLVNSVEQVDQKMLEDIAGRANRIVLLAEEFREQKTKIEDQLTAMGKSIAEANKKVEEMIKIAEEINILTKK